MRRFRLWLARLIAPSGFWVVMNLTLAGRRIVSIETHGDTGELVIKTEEA